MKYVANEFGGYVRFSNEEVVECKTNQDMLAMLVENSEGFVKRCIKGIYLTEEYTYEDKMQFGYEGFLKAVRNFDIERGADFYTYAFQCVQSELFNVHRAHKRAKNGYDEESDTIAFVDSLDRVVDGTEGKVTLESTLMDENTDVFSEAIGIMEGLQRLRKILSESQFDAFTDYYVHEFGLREIAEKRGVSTARIGSIVKKATNIIKERYTEAQFAELIGLR